MIISQLNGGLGNQLFQYAFGRQLAIYNNTELKLDIERFDHYTVETPRKYELDHFKIQASLATHAECQLFQPKMDPFHRAYRLGFILTRKQPPHPKGVIFEKPHFDKAVLNSPDGSYLEGYWQSYKYFEDIEDIIKAEITLKNPLVAKNKEVAELISSTTNPVAIHVRRGDYVLDPATNAFHGVYSVQYYQEALEHLIKKIKNPHFFIFSDDPQWTQGNLKFSYPTTYVTHNTPENGFEDLRLMSLCKHFIIANSSFSWWGAWLSSNPDKQVIAPRKWFAGSNKDTSDLTPPNWLRI
jgi:hypothetical protein